MTKPALPRERGARPLAEAPRQRADAPDVRWNFALNVLDGALFSFGLGFASVATVLPVFVQRLGGGALAIGLIPVVWAVGMSLPQVLVANRVQQVAHRKGLLLGTALVQRLPWLLLAVGTWWWVDGAGADVGLALFFGAFALAALGGSLSVPVWFDVVAAVTPERVRGRLFAVRTVVGSVLAVGAGWAAALVLDRVPYPQSFAVLFGLAFVAMMGSWAALALLHVERRAIPRRRVALGLFLRRLPRLLRRQRNYRNVLVGDALVVTASVASAFFAVDAIARFGLPLSAAGLFTVVAAGASVVAAPVLGHLGDRWGHRRGLVLGAAAAALAPALALVAPSAGVYLVVFALSAVSLVARSVSRLPILAELSAEADRPTYVALGNALTAPFALAGVAAGWVASRYGYDAVFAGTAAVGAVAAYWMLEHVREPRDLRPSPLPHAPTR